MFDTKSKTIDGIEFKVTQFSAVTAVKLKAKLVRIFGPAIGQIIGSVEGGGSKTLLETKIDATGIAKAIETLFSQLDENAYYALVKELLGQVSSKTSINGSEVLVSFANDFDDNFNLVFTGKLFTIYPLIYFVLEVNYPDFFAKVGGFGSRVRMVLSQQDSAKETKSPTE